MSKAPKTRSGRSRSGRSTSPAWLIKPQGDGNARVLLVGPKDRLPHPRFDNYLPRFSALHGFPTEFTSISAAMEAIPLMNAKDNWVDRWVILVTPGWYVEEVRMKPFVSIVGLAADSVFISAPFDKKRPSLKRIDDRQA
jgi:hypothetical protein